MPMELFDVGLSPMHKQYLQDDYPVRQLHCNYERAGRSLTMLSIIPGVEDSQEPVHWKDPPIQPLPQGLSLEKDPKPGFTIEYMSLRMSVLVLIGIGRSCGDR